jgi:hypothetical protein
MRRILTGASLTAALTFSIWSSATATQTPTPTGVTTTTLRDGRSLTSDESGIGWISDARGLHARPIAMAQPIGKSAMGSFIGPSEFARERAIALPDRGLYPTGQVIVLLDEGIAPTNVRAAIAQTNDSRLNALFRDVQVDAIVPLFQGAGSARLDGLMSAAHVRLGAVALDLRQAYLLRTRGPNAAETARRLLDSGLVRYAEPNWFVSSMATDVKILPAWQQNAALRSAALQQSTISNVSASVPTNFGLRSSLQSYLNANGVDAAGAFVDIRQRFGQLPGAGETITNVSIGDLTDEAMARAGDQYVAEFGPTTNVIGQQRYLDYPSMPLIPTFTADMSANLDPLGTVEGVDPFLSEVLLDFSVMAPLPHDQQRSNRQGSGDTDLLGIAPGASYRLVVPQQPTIANILTALIGAAEQQPRPNVINASLGYGFDNLGFPDRFLEDDPLAQSVIAAIVNSGIVVCVASGDGTRLLTPASVGPDGGSAPTDLADAADPVTSVADDAESTIPSRVIDTGSFAVGGSTLDDIFAVAPQTRAPLSDVGTFAQTRTDGETDFASGFGSRVELSAPSDNIVALNHECLTLPCTGHDAVPVIVGGTSASSPMTAAAAAVVLQAARLGGMQYSPQDALGLLEATGRPVFTPPQIDRALHVGPQIDVTAAVEALLDREGKFPQPAIVRVGVAERQNIGNLAATIEEATDPGDIDLTGPVIDFGTLKSGQNGVSPITLSVDAVGMPANVVYEWRTGHGMFARGRVVRLEPGRLLAAAGLPLVDSSPRTINVTVAARLGVRSLATFMKALTFSPYDGTYVEALAPIVPATAPVGSPVTASYDLSHVRYVDAPLLVVSGIGHWSPATGTLFREQWTTPLPALKGMVTIPASAFVGGGGIYGIGIAQDTVNNTVGEFAPIRIVGGDASQRPQAPLLSAGSSTQAGHFLEISRGAAGFDVTYDVRAVPGASGAMLEVSAPGPTIFSLRNPFTDQNGSRRDDNGVDSPSSAFVALPGISGRAHFNATMLGLQSSLTYDVRVDALQGSAVAGQASPDSTLQFDDGFAPGGEFINDFAVSTSSGIAATVAFDGSGNLADSALYSYAPASGAYGAALGDDPSGKSVFVALGASSEQARAVAERLDTTANGQWIQTFDTSDGQQLGNYHLDAATQELLIAGRVDFGRHRAVLLGYDPSDADIMLPFDIDAQTMGHIVNLDSGSNRQGYFNDVSLDESNGRAFAADTRIGDFCIFLSSGVVSVDPSDGAESGFAPLKPCITGIAADDRGGNVYAVDGPLIADQTLLPLAHWQSIAEAGMHVGDPTTVAARSPLFPVVDPVNHVILAAFLAGNDYLTNNDAMSGVGVFDEASGRMLAFDERFNLFSTALGFNPSIASERGIQIDPATRTGWTFGPGGLQIERFTY